MASLFLTLVGDCVENEKCESAGAGLYAGAGEPLARGSMLQLSQLDKLLEKLRELRRLTRGLALPAQLSARVHLAARLVERRYSYVQARALEELAWFAVCSRGGSMFVSVTEHVTRKDIARHFHGCVELVAANETCVDETKTKT